MGIVPLIQTAKLYKKIRLITSFFGSKDIKNKVIRSDALIRKIEEDIKYSDRNLWLGKKEMESWASSLLSYNVSNDIDYYDYYKSKFIKEKTIDNDNLKNNQKTLKEIINDNL